MVLLWVVDKYTRECGTEPVCYLGYFFPLSFVLKPLFYPVFCFVMIGLISRHTCDCENNIAKRKPLITDIICVCFTQI